MADWIIRNFGTVIFLRRISLASSSLASATKKIDGILYQLVDSFFHAEKVKSSNLLDATKYIVTYRWNLIHSILVIGMLKYVGSIPTVTTIKYSVVQSQTDNLDNLSGVENVGSNPSDTTKQLKVVQFI